MSLSRMSIWSVLPPRENECDVFSSFDIDFNSIAFCS